MINRFLPVIFAAFLLLSPLTATLTVGQIPAPTSTPGQLQQDLAAAAETAEEILNLAVALEFNAMYDMIHPDAKAIVPRAAAVGTFDEIYREAKAGPARVIAVEMTPWTWGVTSQDYPNAAKVSFVQPYVDFDGSAGLLEDDMYLVQSDGEWRWFFGSSPQMVQNAIDTFGTSTGDSASPSTVTTEPLSGDLIVNTVNDLDQFWNDVLGYTAFQYLSPGVMIVEQGDSVMSACGPASTGFWGFYCPPDSTMYIDEALLDQLADEGKDFAGAFVIAHEWAHHVQTIVGLERTGRPDQWNELHSIELELMADCLAGSWARDAMSRGAIDETDIRVAMEFTLTTLGDPSYITEYAEQAHGNGEQRVSAFMGGFDDGFLACNLKI